MPLAAALLADLEDRAEQLLRLAAAQEHVLARRVLVAVARRHHDALDAERVREVEEIRHVLRILARIQRAVRRDAEPTRARSLDRGHGSIERAVAAHGSVVTILVAVQVHRERQVRRRRVLIELLLEQQRVRAQIHEFLASDDACDDLRHLFVNQRLAAGNRDDGRAALVDGVERVFDRHALAQDLVGVIDLAATRASEIALEQRLEHQHERIAFVALPASARECSARCDTSVRPGYSFDLLTIA